MKAAGSRRDRIRAQLADLKMPGALEAVDDVLTRVDGGGVTASEAIEQLLGAQIMLRNNRRLQAAMRSSRLPGIKTLDDFDFSFQPSIKREQIDSLHELGFLERKENVIFLGPPGVGKTHLRAGASLLRRSGRSHHLARRSKTAGQSRARRDRLPAGQPDRRHALLPTHQPALRARIHRAHVRRRVGQIWAVMAAHHLARRSQDRRSARTPTSRSSLASCGAEPFTPQDPYVRHSKELE